MFFESCIAGFRNTGLQLGTDAKELRVADHHVRIRFGGDTLVHLERALLHHRILAPPNTMNSFKPALEIMAWSGPANWMPPAPPWTRHHIRYFGEVVHLSPDRFIINYDQEPGLLTMLDQESRRAIYWLQNPSRLPFWEQASPFRTIFHGWIKSIGGHVAHGAVVGKNGRGVLLAGRSGSGKSTTALACLDAGLKYLGDDYVILVRDVLPHAFSLYSAAKIHEQLLDGPLSHWRGRAVIPIGPRRKMLIYLEDAAPESLADDLRIVAIVLPRVGCDEQPHVVPLAPAEGLLALAPSTVFQLPGARQDSLAFLNRWMTGVPVYGLTTARNNLPLTADAVIQILDTEMSKETRDG